MRVAVPFPILLHMVMADCDFWTFSAMLDCAFWEMALETFLCCTSFAKQILFANHGREIFQLLSLAATVTSETNVIQRVVGTHFTTSTFRRPTMRDGIH